MWDITSVLNLGLVAATGSLVIVTGYYALEVRNQTKFIMSMTEGFFSNAKRERLEKEINFLVMPILRLEYFVNVKPFYWNWHDAIIVDDEDLDYVYVNRIKEICDLINNIIYFRYLGPEYLHLAITTYLKNLKNTENLRGRFSKTLDELQEFAETDDIKSAHEGLKKAQVEMFKEANKRYEEILFEFKTKN
jgi:hypothetical protein